jgi:DNA-binding beta-propeller fold protein YncE
VQGGQVSGSKTSVLLGLLIIILAGATACAPPLYERKPADLVWPLPPDAPRIKYVDMFRSTLDFERKKGFIDTLFGEEQVEGFNKPYGVAVDKEGKIYVTDIGRVFVIDLKKKEYEFIGMDPTPGRLANPIGIAMASDGRLFVADTAADRVFVYMKGKYVAAIGKTGEFEGVSGIALDEKRGLIYVVDTRKHVVNVYALEDYSKIRTIGKRGTERGEFNFPTNVAVDAEGRAYVVDTMNFRVQVFDHDGTYLRSIGTMGDSPGSFARPKGIAIDSEGHMYVVDAAFQNFQIFDQEGKLLLFVGGAGVNPGQFLLPAGMTIDDEDRIYVVDQYPGSVQIFQYLGEKWKRKQAESAATGKRNEGGDAKAGK